MKEAQKKQEKLKQIETKKINEFSTVRIVFNEEIQEYFYEVIEPSLNEAELNNLKFIIEALKRTVEMNFDKSKMKEDEYLKKNVNSIINEYSLNLTEETKAKIDYYIIRDFLGYGKIDVLMKDEEIEDISCDGPKIPLFLYHRKYESIETNILFNSEEELDSFVIKLAQRCGKQISISNPLADATMMDGSRLQATLSKEVTAKGSTFTIRKFRADPLTPPDIIDFNTLSTEIASYLWLAIQYGYSIMYAGGTASGKTSLLNAMCLFIPPKMKIVSIEETREVNLPHKNWIAGTTRSGFGAELSSGKLENEIDMFDLLKVALRQRPQYLIVGEIRGKEAYSLFQGMAVGHTTYSTMHADSIEAIIQRLENPPISLPKIILQSLDIALIMGNVRVKNKNVRRVKEVVEIIGVHQETNELIVNTVFKWDPASDSFSFSGNSNVFREIIENYNLTELELKEELRRREEIIELMRKKKIRRFIDVGKVVNLYYVDPLNTIGKLKGG